MGQRLQRLRSWRHQRQQEKRKSKLTQEERLFYEKQLMYLALLERPTTTSVLPFTTLQPSKLIVDVEQTHKRQPRAVTIPERALATSITSHTAFELLGELPYDVVHEFFKYLDPVTSTCLGLTCKSLYPIHRKMQGIVGLQEYISTTPNIEYRQGIKRYIGQYPWPALAKVDGP